MKLKRFILILLAATLARSGGALAQTRLEVHRGWGGVQRAGRWNLITVRASSATPREVAIELIWPHEDGFATVARERAAIGPTAATFELFAPVRHGMWERGVVVLRDVQSGRVVAQSAPGAGRAAADVADFGPGGTFVGVSGRRALAEGIGPNPAARAAYLPAYLLPRTSIGYDGLDILFLDAMQARDLDADQGVAILNWLRAGGTLLYVPGDGSLSDAGPLGGAMPCRVTGVASFDTDAAVLGKMGLDGRSAHVAGHALEPLPGSGPFELFPGGHVTGFLGRIGLGKILVLPIDPSDLQFVGPTAERDSAAFWRPILDALVHVPPPQARRKFDAPYYGYQSESEDQQREGAAVSILCDSIGSNDTKPRRLPFESPVVLGILFLIGPADAFIRRALGRPGFHPITLAGLLGFLALGALAGVRALRPDRVETGAARVVDQFADETVAETALTAVSSADGGEARVPTPSEAGWWQPALPGAVTPGRARAQPDAEFHQTDRGRTVEPVRLDPGRARFFRSDSIAPGAPVVSALLSLRGETPSMRLVGRITNVSGLALKDLRVRTRFGVVEVAVSGGALAAGESVRVDLPAAGGRFAPQDLETRYQSYGYFGARAQTGPVDQGSLWAIAPDMAGRRSLMIDELIDGGSEFACVYARTSAGQTAGPIGRYDGWVRAVAPLKP